MICVGLRANRNLRTDQSYPLQTSRVFGTLAVAEATHMHRPRKSNVRPRLERLQRTCFCRNPRGLAPALYQPGSRELHETFPGAGGCRCQQERTGRLTSPSSGRHGYVHTVTITTNCRCLSTEKAKLRRMLRTVDLNNKTGGTKRSPHRSDLAGCPDHLVTDTEPRGRQGSEPRSYSASQPAALPGAAADTPVPSGNRVKGRPSWDGCMVRRLRRNDKGEHKATTNTQTTAVYKLHYKIR
ncbi:Hypp948 [Branchiostoma lanceolatum]|uniref:Hypp948 protein n=1 Tax=Branchiostoma lanceolatum TaxID=7740 RepID=A0A8J9ZGA9_BRALA|nr:Hypp948 [Branchiostoma lanceolatum]